MAWSRGWLGGLLYFRIQSSPETSDIILVHKKSDKQLVKNYRQISLLSIFEKIFEKIIVNMIYNFISDEKLLNPNQYGFRPSKMKVPILSKKTSR